MDINAVESTYTQIQGSNYSKEKAKSADSEVKETAKTSEAAVYEKSAESADTGKSNGKIYGKSSADRSAIVEQLKAEQARVQQQFVDLVHKMMNQQGGAYAKATDNEDDIWKFLASGEFEVDAETKAQAQKDIAEDGYWGVNQTSERIFDFAMALAGDDENMMKKMQQAFEKGFGEATKAWGKDLPDISSKTRDAVNKKFEEYFESKKAGTAEE